METQTVTVNALVVEPAITKTIEPDAARMPGGGVIVLATHAAILDLNIATLVNFVTTITLTDAGLVDLKIGIVTAAGIVTGR